MRGIRERLCEVLWKLQLGYRLWRRLMDSDPTPYTSLLLPTLLHIATTTHGVTTTKDSGEPRMAKSQSDIESLQAKIVVLGDPRTGKSSLVRALDPYSKNIISQPATSPQRGHSSPIEPTTSFTVIEIPSNELDAVANVFLKFWEYTNTTGPREHEVAFPGALFCIITFDLRVPETANTAFNKWLSMKETYMPESFLFMIGTFLDSSSQRRVEISEICKACAQKEAIYLEVSNLDGSNINLLRRLICQRLNQMLKIREEQKNASSLLGRSSSSLSANETKGAGNENGNPSYSEESKALPPTELVIESITPSLLEKNILSHSIGGIYTSTFYATTSENEWMGFERENQNLMHVGKRISNYIDQVSHGIQLPPPADDYRPASSTPISSTALSEPDADEVRHLFDLMGLPLPPSLQLHNSSAALFPKNKRATIKMKVRLPDGSQASLVLRSDDNIEEVVYQFLVSHDMKEGGPSMDRLIDIGTAMLRKAEEEQQVQQQGQLQDGDDLTTTTIRAGGGRWGGADETVGTGQYDDRTELTMTSAPSRFSASSTAAPLRTQKLTAASATARSYPPKLRKCKARIKLPNNQVILASLFLSHSCACCSRLSRPL
jgi:hypothetical protein